ncbi:Tctex-1 [Tuber indicum]|nr:Tctex-1 [Tuber indicum]
MSESRFPHTTGANLPVPLQRLKQIANDACFAALEKVEVYDHSRTEGWNNTIINHILRALISESTPTGAGPSCSPYKFSVNSTIIQHMAQRNFNYLTTSISTSPSSPAATTPTSQDSTSPVPPAAAASAGVGSELTSGRASNENTGVGRRGMHSACGAYWNNEKDGMWSFKYETKGLDVVISVIWIAV